MIFSITMFIALEHQSLELPVYKTLPNELTMTCHSQLKHNQNTVTLFTEDATKAFKNCKITICFRQFCTVSYAAMHV